MDLNWDDLRIFAAVRQAGSMSAAARNLGTNPATVSRRLARLSEALGVELLLKRPDGWTLNPALVTLAEDLLAFESRIIQHVHMLAGASGEVAGQVTLTAPPTFCTHVLHPAVGKLRQRYPGLSVSMHQGIPSGGLGENDLIVVPVRPMHGRLRVKFLGRLEFDAYGFPGAASLDDPWAGLARSNDGYGLGAWALNVFAREPQYRAENYAGVLECMRSARVPGVLPALVASEAPDLVSIPEANGPFRLPLYLCHHETRSSDPVLKAVVGWIEEAMSGERFAAA